MTKLFRLEIKKRPVRFSNRPPFCLFLPFENQTIRQPDKNDQSKTGLVRISDVDCTIFMY